MISKHVQLGPSRKISSWRKIAMGTWKTAGDPSAYGSMEVDVAPALAFIEKLKTLTGKKITLSHFIGKAIAQTIENHPDINCIIRWGRLYPRKTIDVFFQVAIDDAGKELSGTVIRETNRKSIVSIADELQQKVHAIRLKGDPAFRKMKNTMAFIPGLIVPWLMDFISFVCYTLNLWSPILGSPKDPFGSVMVTNIGMLGLDVAYAPLVPYSRVPLLLAVGNVKTVPVAKDGKVEIAKVCHIGVTVDHRLIDGMHASHMARTLLKIFENPEQELKAELKLASETSNGGV